MQSQQVPLNKPHISGMLNNCFFHMFTQQMIEAVAYFADKEENNNLAINRALDNRKQAYEDFKLIFEQVLLSSMKITWRQLHELLTVKVNHNFLAAQIMFGVAAREYLRFQMDDKFHDHDLLSGAVIGQHTMVKSDGRYELLGFEILTKNQIKNTKNTIDMKKYFLEPLGFQVIAHSKINENDPVYQIDEYKVENPAFKLEAYHEGYKGKNPHWKLTSHGEDEKNQDKKDLHKTLEALKNDCNPLAEPISSISSSGAQETTNNALDLLKTRVMEVHHSKPLVATVNSSRPTPNPSTRPTMNSSTTGTTVKPSTNPVTPTTSVKPQLSTSSITQQTTKTNQSSSRPISQIEKEVLDHLEKNYSIKLDEKAKEAKEKAIAKLRSEYENNRSPENREKLDTEYAKYEQLKEYENYLTRKNR